MVSRMARLGVVLFAAVLAGSALVRSAGAAADIRVRIDREPAPLSESFQIIFETADDVDGAPDFSPLNRDFQVLSTGQSNNISIVNGRTSRSRTWRLTVLARHTGPITIPAIAFGSDRSAPRTITVVAGGAAPPPAPGTGNAPESGDVFLEVEAKPLKTWVQSQVIYTVRLYRAVETANASLSEPEVDGGAAVIEKLGEDRSYATRVMGRDYSVVERSYAIYPQASGTITVRPLQFQGQAGPMPFSLLDPFGPQPETLVRQSAPVALEVEPIAPGFAGDHWLPARQLKLSEAWSRDPPEFRVGEPITRTLTLTADGLTAGQLPELPARVPDGFKYYPDQPALRDAKSPAGIVGTRQEKVALIPSRAGDYTLPELRIAWWDTGAAAVEQAVLPARTIHVLPAAGSQMTDTGGAAASAPQPAAPAEAARPSPAAAGETPSAARPWNVWMAVSAALAAGWLVTLAWFWRRPRRAAAPERAPPVQPAAAARELQQACAAADAARAKDALLRWGRATWDTGAPASIGELKSRCGEALAAELDKLNGALYARAGGGWDGQALWRAFSAEPRRKEGIGARPREDLGPLHRL